MGQPVVHFEIVGTDGEALKAYYAELFGWAIDSSNPMGYGVVARDGNLTENGWGIGGGITAGPPGYPGHVTVYVAVDDVEAALVRAQELGGTRIMGPETVMDDLVIGLFSDPEGHVIGVLRGGGGEM